MHFMKSHVGRRHFAIPCLLALMPLLFCGCESDPEPITAKTSKYEVADDNSAATDSGQVVTDAISGEPSRFTPPSRGAASSKNTTSQKNTTTQQNNARTKTRANADATGGSVARSSTDSTGSQDGSPVKPSSKPPGNAASNAADNDEESLLAEIADLEAMLTQRQVKGATREEQIANILSVLKQIIQLADTVFGSASQDKSKLAAAQYKLNALMALQQLGQPQAKQDFQQFISELTSSENVELQKYGRNIAFAMALGSFGKNPNADAAKLLKDFQAVFADEPKDESLLQLSSEVVQSFVRRNKSAEALAVMKLVREAYRDSPDPKLAAQAKAMNGEIKMLESDINTKFLAFMKGEPDSEKPLVDVLKGLCADKSIQEQSIPTSVEITRQIEGAQFDKAGVLYEAIKTSIGKDTEPELAQLVQSAVEDYDKRKALIGKPFVVEGVTLDGVPFDWAKYEGKVVLVDFWATWYRPCLEELANINENYKKYRDQGMEVVGVNLDEDRQTVESFFSLQKLPWTTVVSADPTQTGFKNPMAVKCSLNAIPFFMVLVGRDGKVVALNTRGELLGSKLAELIPENAKKETPPTK